MTFTSLCTNPRRPCRGFSSNASRTWSKCEGNRLICPWLLPRKRGLPGRHTGTSRGHINNGVLCATSLRSFAASFTMAYFALRTPRNTAIRKPGKAVYTYIHAPGDAWAAGRAWESRQKADPHAQMHLCTSRLPGKVVVPERTERSKPSPGNRTRQKPSDLSHCLTFRTCRPFTSSVPHRSRTGASQIAMRSFFIA